MGFLKKIFKPVSKVLDKIVPNEAKPFLPYLSAFAPMIAPGIMGAFGNTMMSRALMGGGLNLASQLAQEGNEGDVNWLSTALAGGIGALSAPQTDTRAFFEETVRPDSVGFDGINYGMKGSELAESTMLDKGRNVLADVGIKSADFLSKGIASPLSKEGLYTMAGMGSQGLMDTAYNKARLLERDLERDQASDDDDEDSNRALAIRQSMEAYGFTEEEIQDAIAAAGYKKGGRVELFTGGSPIKNLGLDEDYVREIRIQWLEAGKPGRFSEFLRNALDYQAELSDEMKSQMASGGRVGYAGGGNEVIDVSTREGDAYLREHNPGLTYESRETPPWLTIDDFENLEDYMRYLRMMNQNNQGGRIGAFGGGIMGIGVPGMRLPGIPRMAPDGIEFDMRAGGFQNLGAQEGKDDVNAKLAKNEFVMTADAVRGAGGGSIEKGAQRMYDTMKKLESKVV